MIAQVRRDLKQLVDSKKAKIVAGYFKTGKGEYGEGDVFIGVTVPNSWKIARKYKDISLIDIENLLRSKIHEERLIALMILVLQFQKGSNDVQKKIYEFYLENTKYVNNWDLVDTSADHIVGGYLFSIRCHSGLDPESPKAKKGILNRVQDDILKKDDILKMLAYSKNIWERRIAIIATYEFIRNHKYDDTLKIAEILISDSHDLIHKAVGWMLREMGNRDRVVEELFLKKHYKNMPRTMLRYAIEKFPKDLYYSYLRGTI